MCEKKESACDVSLPSNQPHQPPTSTSIPRSFVRVINEWITHCLHVHRKSKLRRHWQPAEEVAHNKQSYLMSIVVLKMHEVRNAMDLCLPGGENANEKLLAAARALDVERGNSSLNSYRQHQHDRDREVKRRRVSHTWRESCVAGETREEWEGKAQEQQCWRQRARDHEELMMQQEAERMNGVDHKRRRRAHWMWIRKEFSMDKGWSLTAGWKKNLIDENR